MNVFFVDGIYPEVARRVAVSDRDFDGLTWRRKVERLLEERFGCWDSWSVGVRAHGVEAQELLIGVPGLSEADQIEHACNAGGVIVYRHLSGLVPEFVAGLRDRGARAVVAMVSSEAPEDRLLAAFDVIVTAFPHYAVAMEARGLNVRYLPLAFDPRRLRPTGLDGLAGVDVKAASEWAQRDLPASFVGGLGIGRHWKRGRGTIEQLCSDLPDFAWWGYRGPGTLAPHAEARHRGEAWGDHYFEIMGRTKCAVNRHGEVHSAPRRDGEPGREWWACNMRLFEATGMGALLFTERAPNLEPGGWKGWPEPLFAAWDECIPYENPRELAQHITHYLAWPERAREIAEAGQRRCLENHTYERRAGELLTWIGEATA